MANLPCNVCRKKICTEADRNTDGTYTCRACLYLHSGRPGLPADSPPAPPKAPA